MGELSAFGFNLTANVWLLSSVGDEINPNIELNTKFKSMPNHKIKDQNPNCDNNVLANRLFIDGNLLQEKDNKVFYKIYTEFAEPLVWQIGLGYWGTVNRFKKVVKERKIELEVLGNLFDNPELLTQTTSIAVC